MLVRGALGLRAARRVAGMVNKVMMVMVARPPARTRARVMQVAAVGARRPRPTWAAWARSGMRSRSLSWTPRRSRCGWGAQIFPLVR
eukprot:5758673-Pyramimonas_sp.AAC.1